MDIKPRILEVLSRGHLMSMSTIDEGGLWVADVVYVYDESLNIYWMSDPDVRHSQAVIKNGQVAGTITISNKSKEPNLGIQFSGRAERLEGIQFELLVKHLTKRGYSAPDISQAEKMLDGDRWYKLTPKKIDLIDEEAWGYNKKSVDL